MNNYKVEGYFKRESNGNEYVLMVNDKGEKYISNGVYKWGATIDKINQLKEIREDRFNKEKFVGYWNRNMGYSTIQF